MNEGRLLIGATFVYVCWDTGGKYRPPVLDVIWNTVKYMYQYMNNCFHIQVARNKTDIPKAYVLHWHKWIQMFALFQEHFWLIPVQMSKIWWLIYFITVCVYFYVKHIQICVMELIKVHTIRHVSGYPNLLIKKLFVFYILNTCTWPIQCPGICILYWNFNLAFNHLN